MTLIQIINVIAEMVRPPRAPEGWRTCGLCGGTGHSIGSTYAYLFPCPCCDGKGIIEESE